MQPALKEERYKILDVVRGFALLGIIVANMMLYSLYLDLPASKTQSLATYSLDKIFVHDTIYATKGGSYRLFI